MGIEELQRIKTLLLSSGAKFEVFEHEPVRTSEDAAKVRKAPLKEGIKAIVVKERNTQNFYVANVPADKKVDFKKLASIVGVDSLTMASHEEVLEQTGCEVGGVPPLGHKKQLPLFVDSGVFNNEFNEFNAGLTTVSIRLGSGDLRKAFNKLHATECDISK